MRSNVLKRLPLIGRAAVAAIGGGAGGVHCRRFGVHFGALETCVDMFCGKSFGTWSTRQAASALPAAV